MKRAILVRDDPGTDCIRGRLFANGEVIYTLELPWLDNRNNVSCIPVGEYDVAHLERSASGKYRGVYALKHVSGRGGILIHNGNIVDHTHGCILTGLKRGILAGHRAILNSRSGLIKLVNTMGKNKFKLSIQGGQL